MSHYESLRDYFQEEHIELIMNAVKEHISYELKVDCQVNAPCVKSIECIEIDTLYNVEYELGLAADIVEDDKIVSSSFLLTIRGNLEKNLKDINVIYVRDINEDDFPKDNLLNQFTLPDWSESEMEGLGSGLYEFYKSHGLYRKYKLNIHMLVDDGILYFAPLPANCLGRVILSKLDVKVIQRGYRKPIITRTIPASPGTILLNYKNYGVNKDGGLRITVAHELIHSAFHRAFLKILQLLGEEKIDLNSSTGNVTSYENMTDIQKALCIAEWQANELSMRFAMPETTIKSLLDDMAFTPYLYDNKGDWIQVLINTLAKEYGVSPLIAKSRLRQLGYDYVDGTCLGSDDHRKKPFYFPLGTLKGNESFVINRSNFERVTRENECFAKLINSGRYIFLGHVVCMFSSKYVIAISNSDNYEVEFELSDYAREHADECLIIFKYRSITKANDFFPNNISLYLNKMPDYNEVTPESFELPNEDTGIDKKTKDLIEKYNDECIQLKSDSKKTFANTMIYHMKKTENDMQPIDDIELAKRTKLSLAAIKKIYSGETKNIDIRNVMVLCLALQLNFLESYDMFKKAGYDLMADTLQNQTYRFIIENQVYSLEDCNSILRYFNQDEVPYHRGQ